MSDDGGKVVDLAAVRANQGKQHVFTPFINFEGRPGECECRDFVLGVEVGLLVARLEAAPQQWSGTYHDANRIMLESVATAYGYVADIDASAPEGWVFCTFAPKDEG